MQSHPEHNDAPPPSSRNRSILIGIGVVAVLLIIVTLHLTGVVGAGTQ